MAVAILLEALTLIGTIVTSYIYEGKSLLKLGRENYKIRFGEFENYNKDLEQNLFPPFCKEKRPYKFYLECILFLIPGVNLLCSHIKGNKRYKTIVYNLSKKRIIVPMTMDEVDTYQNSEKPLEKIHYILFNSMESYKPYEIDLEGLDTCVDSIGVTEISEEVEKEAYERDISYIEALLSLEESYEPPKQKKLKKSSK